MEFMRKQAKAKKMRQNVRLIGMAIFAILVGDRPLSRHPSGPGRVLEGGVPMTDAYYEFSWSAAFTRIFAALRMLCLMVRLLAVPAIGHGRLPRRLTPSSGDIMKKKLLFLAVQVIGRLLSTSCITSSPHIERCGSGTLSGDHVRGLR